MPLHDPGSISRASSERDHEHDPDHEQALPELHRASDSTDGAPVPQRGLSSGPWTWVSGRSVRQVLRSRSSSGAARDLGAALFALLVFEPNRHPEADRWDSPSAARARGYGHVWARWDSDWYLRIAEDGTRLPRARPAFFPLYPAIVGASAASLRALRAGRHRRSRSRPAFVLLYRLAAASSARTGRRAVLYLAVFPTALFLQAVYSESLYLASSSPRSCSPSAGASSAPGGRRARLLTRPVGIALLPALALLAGGAETGGRSASTRRRVPIAALYPLLLAIWIDEPFAFLRAQDGIWQRVLSGPGRIGGLWDGVAVAFAHRPTADLALNLQQLAAHARSSSLWRYAAAGASARRTGSSRSAASRSRSRSRPSAGRCSRCRASGSSSSRSCSCSPSRRAAARPRRDRLGELAPAGRRRGAMGPVAMGGMSPIAEQRRLRAGLVGWRSRRSPTERRTAQRQA